MFKKIILIVMVVLLSFFISGCLSSIHQNDPPADPPANKGLGFNWNNNTP